MRAAQLVRRELVRLRRRALVAGWSRGTSALAVGAAAVLAVVVLGARVLDQPVVPRPWWAGVLLLLAGVAAVRAARRTPPAGAFAPQLDRRLGAEGLLLASLERDAAGWEPDVRARLKDAARRIPRPRLAGDALRVLLAAGGVALLALLPAPEPARVVSVARAIERALEAARDDLDLAAAAGLVDEREAEELLRRAEELRERLLAGDPVAWSDVDALAERIDSTGENALAGLRAVEAGAAALLQEIDARGLEPRDVGELGRLAQRALELGMLEGLSPELREALEQLGRQGGTEGAEGATDRGGAGLEPGALDPERLRQLAEALKEHGGRRIREAARTARGERPGADELRRMLEEQGILGQGGAGGEPGAAQGPDGFDPTPGPDGEGGPGRGGINRGRGDAALQYYGDSDIDASGMRAERLPEGVIPPDRWDVASVGRAEPEAGPERPAGVGTGGATAGGPGDVTFRRDLAPRHRDAVRRFFGGDDGR